MLPPRRLLVCAVAVVAGVVGGFLGSFVHSLTSYGVPVGLITALALSLSIFVTAGIASGSRLGAGLAAAGWLLTVLLLTVRRPEGDLIIAGTLLGYAWLIAGMVVAGGCVAWPYGTSHARASRGLQRVSDAVDDRARTDVRRSAAPSSEGRCQPS